LKILLVNPDISGVSVGFSSLARVAPMGLLMVAGSVPDHECQILDMRLEESSAFDEALRGFRPDVIGLTAYSAEAEAAKALAQRAKQVLPHVPIVWGGYHATMALDDVLDEPCVDFTVQGEGEATFPELIEAIACGGPYDGIAGIAFRRGADTVLTPPRPQIADLDTLPFPSWDLVARYQPYYYLGVMGTVGCVESSRGCPHNCSFCSVWVFNQRRYRKKSPGRVMAELERLPDGIQIAAFVDDEFWVDAGRALEIAALIDERNRAGWRGSGWNYWAQVRSDDIARRPDLVERWAKVGLKVLLVGIESLKKGELRSLHNKRTTVSHAVQALATMRKHAVEPWGCFIINPEWTKKDFDDLREFVIQQRMALLQYTVLTVLPGTVLAAQLQQRKGIKVSDIPHSLLDFLHATYPPPRLPLPEFYEQMARLYRETGLAIPSIYRRLVRNGVISREWLKSEIGRQVVMLFGQLSKPSAYLKAHRLLGEQV